jgi:hypothetical protein
MRLAFGNEAQVMEAETLISQAAINFRHDFTQLTISRVGSTSGWSSSTSAAILAG